MAARQSQCAAGIAPSGNTNCPPWNPLLHERCRVHTPSTKVVLKALPLQKTEEDEEKRGAKENGMPSECAREAGVKPSYL